MSKPLEKLATVIAIGYFVASAFVAGTGNFSAATWAVLAGIFSLLIVLTFSED